MPRSTFFYILKSMKKEDKDRRLKGQIKDLYEKNTHKNEKYGYRRICDCLRAMPEYSHINHKKVQRLMKEMGLFGYISKTGARKYSSYHGTVGKVADNVVKRHFKARRPNALWSTDITEFKLPACDNAKVYLSPIKDFCDGSIVSYSYSTSPNMALVHEMQDKALDRLPCLAGLVFHSDYQHETYVKKLDNHCITQSMSRKGNCLDNSKMETFFSTLKKAIWFGHEKDYKSVEDLYAAIDTFIKWYNEERIQHKLKGLSPLQYRKQAFKLVA